jgi:REP element-mobilizing transposase RayT
MPVQWSRLAQAYCLTPNHVHLILTPVPAEGRSRAVGEGGGALPAP